MGFAKLKNCERCFIVHMFNRVKRFARFLYVVLLKNEAKKKEKECFSFKKFHFSKQMFYVK